jgi:hypothetical protein
MRKLEETINRSGMWRPDVPHFIDEDTLEGVHSRRRDERPSPFVVGCGERLP